ncbi:MAG TPA: FAD-dependent oxidoreductase [Alphaproteobacteria bacterium]|nr:FAD-dependent oxidoreductase [Alphaproteobacteria bacterium]
MPRDPRYDILFEPVRIGPVTAKNRFFQVPHCNGMGMSYPSTMAAMRRMKAEGGWAVVCTEETDIHPSGDMSPLIEGRLWDDRDIPVFARMNEGIHEQGALAGIELVHVGPRDACLYSREIPIAVSHQPVHAGDYPAQARAMDRSDIKAYRRWHRDAALRAKRAGFDIIYVYCRAGTSLNGDFLSRTLNRRTDEYGGSLQNRVRLLREVLEDTREAVGASCAVALRFTVDDPIGPDGEADMEESRAVIEMLSDLPDVWDVNLREWRRDSMPSRFGEEGSQEQFVSFVKTVTKKPVVGVGRFTSPDTMVSQIRRGVLDFVGAARPSIADPFLPRKIEEGRIDDIRECIGCNICVSSDFTIVPMRCTQNPTIGEEWRKGWHPEMIPTRASDDRILVVGAGPAGLECARALGQRGYEVTLAEARNVLGGRVADESRLPGLATWGRVRDYRVQQIQRMTNVQIYLESDLNASQVLEFGFPKIVLATGGTWRRDGVGRWRGEPVPGLAEANIYTPEDIFAGKRLDGPVVIYDDDRYYMGGVLAEKLRLDGLEVTLVTPSSDVSKWSYATLEQEFIEQRLYQIGVKIIEKHGLVSAAPGEVRIHHVHSGRERILPCSALLMVTMRLPNDALFHELASDPDRTQAAGIRLVTRIGDCLAPSTIAAAVYAGHRSAREMDAPPSEGVPFKREMIHLE